MIVKIVLYSDMRNPSEHFRSPRRAHEGGLSGMQDPSLEITPRHPMWQEYVRSMHPDLSDEELDQVTALALEQHPVILD